MYSKQTLNKIEKVSSLVQIISPGPRLAIILAIGEGEACVCHLKSLLGYRQSYISQHLMALREAGLLRTRREGKFVLYSLEKPEILEIVHHAAHLAGVDSSLINTSSLMREPCKCAHCVISPGKKNHK